MGNCESVEILSYFSNLARSAGFELPDLGSDLLQERPTAYWARAESTGVAVPDGGVGTRSHATTLLMVRKRNGAPIGSGGPRLRWL